jgi:hypothetical protein
MELQIDKINYDTIDENVEDNFKFKLNLLKDLPIECQINKNNIIETFNNLYTWYIHNNNVISQLSEPFYSDYVLVKSLTCINLLNTRDLNQDIKNNVKLI